MPVLDAPLLAVAVPKVCSLGSRDFFAEVVFLDRVSVIVDPDFPAVVTG